jgi:hypothetical protein
VTLEEYDWSVLLRSKKILQWLLIDGMLPSHLKMKNDIPTFFGIYQPAFDGGCPANEVWQPQRPGYTSLSQLFTLFHKEVYLFKLCRLSQSE